MFTSKRGVQCLQSRVVHCSEMFLRGKSGSLLDNVSKAREVHCSENVCKREEFNWGRDIGMPIARQCCTSAVSSLTMIIIIIIDVFVIVIIIIPVPGNVACTSAVLYDNDDHHRLLDTIVWNTCGAIIELVDSIRWHTAVEMNLYKCTRFCHPVKTCGNVPGCN